VVRSRRSRPRAAGSHRSTTATLHKDDRDYQHPTTPRGVDELDDGAIETPSSNSNAPNCLIEEKMSKQAGGATHDHPRGQTMNTQEFDAVLQLWKVLGPARFLGLHLAFFLGALTAARLPKTSQRAVAAPIVLLGYLGLGHQLTRRRSGR